MADEAKIASKVQKKTMDIMSQLVTEAGITFKEHLDLRAQQQAEKDMGDFARMQKDVKDHPQKYHILYLEHGSKDELEQILDQHDIQYLHIDPSVLEHKSGGYIIADTDYITLVKEENERINIQHLYTKEQLEEQGLDEYGQDEEERTEAAKLDTRKDAKTHADNTKEVNFNENTADASQNANENKEINPDIADKTGVDICITENGEVYTIDWDAQTIQGGIHGDEPKHFDLSTMQAPVEGELLRYELEDKENIFYTYPITHIEHQNEPELDIDFDQNFEEEPKEDTAEEKEEQEQEVQGKDDLEREDENNENSENDEYESSEEQEQEEEELVRSEDDCIEDEDIPKSEEEENEEPEEQEQEEQDTEEFVEAPEPEKDPEPESESEQESNLEDAQEEVQPENEESDSNNAAESEEEINTDSESMEDESDHASAIDSSEIETDYPTDPDTVINETSEQKPEDPVEDDDSDFSDEEPSAITDTTATEDNEATSKAIQTDNNDAEEIQSVSEPDQDFSAEPETSNAAPSNSSYDYALDDTVGESFGSVEEEQIDLGGHEAEYYQPDTFYDPTTDQSLQSLNNQDYTPQPEPQQTINSESEYIDPNSAYDAPAYQQDQDDTGLASSGFNGAESIGLAEGSTPIDMTDDVMIDDKNGRSRDALENTVYQATLGDAIEEAHGTGYEQANRFFNGIANGQAGLSGLINVRDTVEKTFTKEEIQTLSCLMQEDGLMGLNFSSASKMEESYKNMETFFMRNKLLEGHSFGGISTKLAVDNKHEYGRNQFGKEAARTFKGDYKNFKDQYTKNVTYSKQYVTKLVNKHNQGLKKGDENYINKDRADALLAKLYAKNGKNIQKFSSSYQSYILGEKTKHGESGLHHNLSLNWRNNALVQDALNQNEGVQGLKKPFALKSQLDQSRKAAMTLSKLHSEYQSVKQAQKQTIYQRRLAEMRKQQKLTGQFNKEEFDKLRQKAKQAKDKAIKASNKTLKRKNQLEKIANKKLNRKKALKQSTSKMLNKTATGRKLLSANAAVNKGKEAVVQRFNQSIIGKFYSKVNGARQKINEFLLKKLAKPLLAFLFWFLQLFLKALIAGMIIGLFLDIISMFVLGNDKDAEDDPAYGQIQTSVLGDVYSQLLSAESGWVHNLKYELFTGSEPIWLDSLSSRYTKFKESDGSVDWNYFHISSEEYVTMVIDTEYELEGGQEGYGWAKGPTPFPDAPEEAYKWIRLLDGGVEVRFRGIGSNSGRTSNIKEIMAMASVAQIESDTTVEDSPDSETDLSDDNPWWTEVAEGVAKFVDWVINLFKDVLEAFNRLLRSSIPLYGDWWISHQAEKQSKMYMLYCSPLFEYSHTKEYSLQMAIHPTKKTVDNFAEISASGAEDSDPADDAGAYTWGEMCSGITDQSLKDLSEYYDESIGDYDGGDYGGYGCMTYGGFEFKYDSDTDMYYNGTLCPQVYPIAMIEEGRKITDDTKKDICVAPGSDPERWLQVTSEYGNNDCWYLADSFSVGRITVDVSYENVSWIDAYAGSNEGYAMIFSPDGGNRYSVWVCNEGEQNGDGSMSYEITVYVFQHSCLGDHTGVYCGGHMKIIVTGGIYHMSEAQIQHNEEAYDEKVATTERLQELGLDDSSYYDSEGYLKNIYHVLYTDDDGDGLYDENDGTPFLVQYVGSDRIAPTEDALNSCRDLFDIDASYTHKYGIVNFQKDENTETSNFQGWNYDFIHAAAIKLEDSWKDLYDIDMVGTVGGYSDAGTTTSSAGGSSNSSSSDGGQSYAGLATSLASADKDEILEYLDSLYADDPSWPTRRAAVERALTYVGKISYSQKHHGNALKDGGLNDCSGYASQVWISTLQKTYTTSTFYTNFNTKKFDSDIMPGDILLHYGGAIADGSNDHALVYIGQDPVTGLYMSVDCSSGGVYYRSRGDSYYSECYYIDMGAVAGY